MLLKRSLSPCATMMDLSLTSTVSVLLARTQLQELRAGMPERFLQGPIRRPLSQRFLTSLKVLECSIREAPTCWQYTVSITAYPTIHSLFFLPSRAVVWLREIPFISMSQHQEESIQRPPVRERWPTQDSALIGDFTTPPSRWKSPLIPQGP